MVAEEKLVEQTNPHDKKAKKPTVRQVFMDRMRREGRYKEFQRLVKELMAETGKRFGHVAWEAMRRMGYTDAKTEWKLYDEYIANLHKTSAEIETEKIQEEIREEVRVMNFEEAVRTLPDNCPVSVEINWLRAHPAMSRKHRQDNPAAAVIITADDILCAPHGKAPSKASVYALQHWSNNPAKFYEMLLSEQKKQADENADRAGASADVGLDEVERLLREVGRETGVVEVASPGTSAQDAERGRGVPGIAGPGADHPHEGSPVSPGPGENPEV